VPEITRRVSSGSLAIIDTTTNTVTHTAQAGLGTEPTAIAFT
jgi:YVTN family beta-propeller protein